MSDGEIYGRQLCAQLLQELSAMGQLHQQCLGTDISPQSFTYGLISGLVIVLKNFPFEASALSHFQLAETILHQYFIASGDTQALRDSQEQLTKIKEQLYGHPTFNKITPSIN